MRGRQGLQPQLIVAFNVENMIPPDHPLGEIKRMADQELTRLSPRFAKAYSTTERPSVPPEMLIKAALLWALYSISSEHRAQHDADSEGGGTTLGMHAQALTEDLWLKGARWHVSSLADRVEYARLVGGIAQCNAHP